MIEVERKYKVKDLTQLRLKLKKLGARLVKTKVQIDTYYSPPGQSFLGRPVYLRLRQTIKKSQTSYYFEYHRPYGGYAAREYETAVENGPMFRYILRHLGFRKELIVTKKREDWAKGQIKIELDQVRGLGKFVELEIMGESQAQALIKIDKLAHQLKLTAADLSLGYFKLLLAKNRPAVWKKYYGSKNIKKRA